MIAPNCAHLTGPAVLDAKHAFSWIAFNLFASGRLKNDRFNAEERLHRRTGFHRMCAGQGGHQVTACFRLPPCIDDGATPPADDFIVPVPCLWIDRLAYRAKDAQGGEVSCFHEGIALTHQRAQSGRGSVELVHFVLFADLPEA